MAIRKVSRELVKGSISLFILFNLFNVLNFVFQFAMARMLGPKDFGIFAALITLVYFIAIPSESIQTVVSKYTSKFKVEKELGKVKDISYRFFRKGFAFTLGIFVLSLLPLWAFSYFINVPFSLVLLTSAMAFTVFFVPVTRGVMQGMKQFNALGINMVLDTLIRIVVAVFLVFLGFRVYGAIIGILIGTILAFLISFIPLRKIFSEKRKRGNVSKIYEYGSPIMIALLAILMMQSIDIILAKRFFSPEIAGQYAVVNLVGKMIFFGTLAISKAMFPLSSENFENGTKTNKIFQKSFLMVLGLSVISLFFLWLFPELIIGLLFGEEYLAISGLVFFIGIAFTLISLANVVFLYGVSTNRKISVYRVVPVLILQVILLWWFQGSLLEYTLAMIVSSFVLFISSLGVIRKRN